MDRDPQTPSRPPADDFCDLPIETVSGLIDRREISPVDLTRAVLERIDRLDGASTHSSQCWPNRRSGKRAAPRPRSWPGGGSGRCTASRSRVKDIFDTARHPHNRGVSDPGDNVPGRDAAVVTPPGGGGRGADRQDQSSRSSPTAPSIPTTARPATPGTRPGSPAAPAAARPRRSPPGGAWAARVRHRRQHPHPGRVSAAWSV